MKTLKQLIISVLSLVSVGCVGIDTTAVYTKSNIGIDLSTTPPTTAIDISRTEGVITPQFEEGKVLPVLASFKTGDKSVFSGDIRTTFSTGKAAVTMARLYNSNSVPEAPINSELKLNSEPLINDKNPLQKSNPKPVLFTTKTSVGLNLSWATATAAYPESFTLGFNRKELAILPISYSNNGTDHTVDQASLLATLDYVYEDVANLPIIEDSKSKKTYLQYFAIGDSASYLALQPDVRITMLKRLDPETNQELSEAAIMVLPALLTQIRALAKTDSHARTLLTKVDSKIFPMSSKYFVSKVETLEEPATSATNVRKGSEFTLRAYDFDNLYAYVDYLRSGIKGTEYAINHIQNAINNKVKIDYLDNKGVIVWSKIPTEKELEEPHSILNILEDEYEKHRKILSENNEVNALFSYSIKRLSEN